MDGVVESRDATKSAPATGAGGYVTPGESFFAVGGSGGFSPRPPEKLDFARPLTADRPQNGSRPEIIDRIARARRHGEVKKKKKI